MGLIKLVANIDQLRGPVIPTVTGTNKSLAFADSATEKLAATVSPPAAGSFICTHTRTKFSISCWIKRGVSATTKTFFDFSQTGGVGGVQITTTTTNMLTQIRRPGTLTVEKSYRLTITDANWQHIAIVVEAGASEELLIYRNGSVIVPTKLTDLPLSDRKSVNMSFIDSVGESLTGNMYSLALWDKALTANEITVIYNGGNAPGVNLLVNQGKYKSAKKCRHWFVFEANPGNLGKDYGRASYERINLMTSALNISAADDLVVDSPTG